MFRVRCRVQIRSTVDDTSYETTGGCVPYGVREVFTEVCAKANGRDKNTRTSNLQDSPPRKGAAETGTSLVRNQGETSAGEKHQGWRPRGPRYSSTARAVYPLFRRVCRTAGRYYLFLPFILLFLFFIHREGQGKGEIRKRRMTGKTRKIGVVEWVCTGIGIGGGWNWGGFSQAKACSGRLSSDRVSKGHPWLSFFVIFGVLGRCAWSTSDFFVLQRNLKLEHHAIGICSRG